MTQTKVKKLKLWLLCGGQSPEHTVSLSSARTCLASLDLKKYMVKPVCITRNNGLWLVPEEYLDRASPDKGQAQKWFNYFSLKTQEKLSLLKQQGIQTLPINSALKLMKSNPPDLVFILLHGPYGEDGTLQGLLDFFNVPYTGSGVLASSLAMDKIRCQKFLAAQGIPVPQAVGIKIEARSQKPETSGKRIAYKIFLMPKMKKLKLDELWEILAVKLGIPVIVKPSRCGSSVGMTKVEKKSALMSALELAKNYDSEILIEKFIRGKELTCGILEIPQGKELKPVALPVTEIVPKEAPFFDYDSKYIPGKTEEITPARISLKKTEKIQELALAVFEAIGCRDMARVDFILADDGSPYVLEINTIPGMTPTSLLPQGAKAAGINFTALLNHIIHSARNKYKI